MKNPRLILPLLAACAVLPVTGLFAQTAAPAAPAITPSVSAPAGTADTTAEEGEKGGGDRKFYNSLTPEEKQKLRAANKAARQDPAVKAAEANKSTDKRGYRKALREAMIKADPSVAAILEKRKEERHPGKNL